MKLAELGEERLHCGKTVLIDAVTGSLNDIHRTLLRQHLDRIALLDSQIEALNVSAQRTCRRIRKP